MFALAFGQPLPGGLAVQAPTAAEHSSTRAGSVLWSRDDVQPTFSASRFYFILPTRPAETLAQRATTKDARRIHVVSPPGYCGRFRKKKKKKKVLKMATFKDVCSFGYLFFNWDLLQRLLEDANRAEQSGNLPLSDRTAAGLRLNLHSQPAKQSKRRVCLRSLSLPVRMFEPGGGAASLLRKRRHF